MDRLMKGDHLHNEVDLRVSIHQNIELILQTFSLSYRFDPTFGCVMNKYQAKTPPQRMSDRAWKESIRESIQKNLKDMFSRYESRIRIRDVIVDLKPVKRGQRIDSIAYVSVQVIGQLALGRRDAFYFPDSEIDDAAQEVFPLMIPIGRLKD